MLNKITMKTLFIITTLITACAYAGCESPGHKSQHASTPRIIHGANKDNPNYASHDVNAMRDPGDRYSPDEYAQKKDRP